jgi:hypothetical protein
MPSSLSEMKSVAFTMPKTADGSETTCASRLSRSEMKTSPNLSQDKKKPNPSTEQAATGFPAPAAQGKGLAY